MKVLLVGPYPPPHGGISVHVFGIHQQLTAAGVRCLVLDPSRAGGAARFAIKLLTYAWSGWTIHVHANGHNWKSWFIALACGLAGRFGGCLLTLHSGMAAAYLATARGWRRRLVKLACLQYHRVICVSPAIHQAVLALGITAHRTSIAHACLHTPPGAVTLDPALLTWMDTRKPLLATAVFFRPEYGFDLLLRGLAELRNRYPSFGCLVMGGGEDQITAQAQIAQSSLGANILLLGDVDHDTCVTLMARCDLFVRSTLEDGDSISVREALTLGVPVVASRVGMRPAGVILFQPGSLEDMVSKIELGLSRTQSEDLTMSGHVDNLLEIYRQVDHRVGVYAAT